MPRVITIVSANIEWNIVRDIFADVEPQTSPFGEWFTHEYDVAGQSEPVVFFHGGWGKISAAATAQYTIDRWTPDLIVNIGTCGGFAGAIDKGTIILVERTIVYDIYEQMGDHDEHIARYTTDLDLSWLGGPYPHPVQRGLLVSGDRDLRMEDIPHLREEYGAVAGDWESAAIAWVAQHNDTRCLILRGVTDLVGTDGGEAYDGNIHVFIDGARSVLQQLTDALPAWFRLSSL